MTIDQESFDNAVNRLIESLDGIAIAVRERPREPPVWNRVQPEDLGLARGLTLPSHDDLPQLRERTRSIAQALAAARTEGAKRMRERAAGEAMRFACDIGHPSDAHTVAERIRALEIDE